MTDQDENAEAPELSVPERTRDITRGGARLLCDLGYAVIVEFPLATGRRVDIIAVDRAGTITVIEVKASVADFRGDRKWREYLAFCDRFYFCVAPDFPRTVLPQEPRCGLIIADRYGGDVVVEPETIRLPAARRKAVTLRFARVAAQRLQALMDPKIPSSVTDPRDPGTRQS